MKNQQSMERCSRREFLGKTATAGAGAAFAAAGVASAAEVSSLPETWDYEVDVVVVGSGSVAPAALRAHDLGLEVIMLEKHPTWFGGTSALIGGGIVCPNHPLTIPEGEDPIPREMVKGYIEECAGGLSKDELIEMMLDNYVPAIDYLGEECDFPLRKFSIGHPGTTDAAHILYEPFTVLEDDYSARVCTVGTQPHPSGTSLGRAIRDYTLDALEERDIKILMGTAATKLIYKGNPVEGDGEVVGLYAEGPDGTIAIKARYGVVLGTGGYDHNREMVKHYPLAPIYGTAAIETNTGDGHIMAMEVGANMRNMSQVFHACIIDITGRDDGMPEYQVTRLESDQGVYASEEVNTRVILAPGKTGAILVNKHGERFGNESSCYDLFGRHFAQFDTGFNEWRNIPGFLIFDETYQGALGNGMPSFQAMLESEVPSYIRKYETMEELADGMGINKENLLATVERYNGYCETGVDLQFNRGASSYDRFTNGDPSRVESGELKNACLAPLNKGPFYCVILYPGMLQTKGGIDINGNAQVLNVRGEVIPRLYAASNCIANTLGRGYGWGGGTVQNGYIVSYVAANHIATLTPWEE